MKKFIQDSLHEFHHVVFPTHKETRQYLSVVLSCIVVFGIFLYILESTLSSTLYAVKTIVKPYAPTQANTPSGNPSDLRFDTGATASGQVSTDTDLPFTISGANLPETFGSGISGRGESSTGTVAPPIVIENSADEVPLSE